MTEKRILIIIPAYNENGNILRTIAEVKQEILPIDILVIDDGSEDETAQSVMAAGIPIISLPFNLGIGGAVQTGLWYARRRGYDIAVQVDADGQHDARFIGAIVQPVIDGKADLSIGSRFIPPLTGYRSSFVRRIGITFFSHLISFLIGVEVTDPTSGFRAFSKKAIDVFADDYPSDFPEPESIVKGKLAGLTVLEVPVEMRKRQEGHSSIRYLMTLYYMIKVTCAILLDMIKKRKKG